MRLFAAAAWAIVVGSLTLAVGFPATADAAVDTSPADAAPVDTSTTSGRSVTRWDATYVLDPDGSATATVQIDLNFGDNPGHGAVFTFPTTQPIKDSNLERVWDIRDIEASSPSGAPDDVSVERDGDMLVVRIGDEDIDDVSGTQTYQVSYSIAHVMNDTTGDETASGAAGDEFYWNAVPWGWSTPVSNISVTVVSEVAATDARCFAGVQQSEGCEVASGPGTTTTFTAAALTQGQAFSIATLYPSGSFDTTATTQVANDLARGFSLAWWNVGLAVVIAVGGTWWVIRRIRRIGHDLAYAGVTPGLEPISDSEAAVIRRDRKAPIAVQFEPPRGLRPGQLGTLVDEKADVRDVTATIIDQAVRGYLRIEPVGDDDDRDPQDYRLVRLREADEQMPVYGRMLFEAIFATGDSVTMSDLKTTFAADLAKVQDEMYRDVTERGWFRRNPKTARATWGAVSFVTVFVGVAATFVLGTTLGAGLIGGAITLVGLIALCLTGQAPARTPEGSRVLAQTEGFKLYLETADAAQLKFEEGQDIFSRYLPFAVAFGVAQRWADLFARLAREGYDLPAPQWYGGNLHGSAFWLYYPALGRQMADLTSLTDAAISAPTPGSSGGSAFSSGGGFSGGGNFGGGGGAW